MNKIKKGIAIVKDNLDKGKFTYKKSGAIPKGKRRYLHFKEVKPTMKDNFFWKDKPLGFICITIIDNLHIGEISLDKLTGKYSFKATSDKWLEVKELMEIIDLMKAGNNQ